MDYFDSVVCLLLTLEVRILQVIWWAFYGLVVENLVLFVYQTQLLGVWFSKKDLSFAGFFNCVCDMGVNLPQVDATRQAQKWDTSQISKHGRQMRAPWQVVSEEVQNDTVPLWNEIVWKDRIRWVACGHGRWTKQPVVSTVHTYFWYTAAWRLTLAWCNEGGIAWNMQGKRTLSNK
jgi:hypothetical protein